MILKITQKEDIVRRIDFIRIQLEDLEKFKSLDWEKYQKDRDVQRNVERLVENVANAVIDISKILLVGEDIEMPNSYKDIIIKLGLMDILEQELASKIAGYAALRNVLAHQYLDLRWDKIKKFIKEAPEIVPKFLEAVKKKL